MKSELLIIGGKSTALEIFDVVETYYSKLFTNVIFVIGDNENIFEDYNYIKDSDIIDYVENRFCRYILSFANFELRLKFELLFDRLGISPINIIHPSSIISNSAKIGIGNYIAAGCVISSKALISNHCLINFGSSVGHDTFIKDHCIINPGTRISGNVKIGSRVLLGSNSFVFQGKTIGDNCVIDALTYIDRNIDNNMICSSKQLRVFKRVI